VSGADKGVVQCGEDLLGAADGLEPNRREGVSETQDRQWHAAAVSSSRISAAWASSEKRDDVIPQGC
jgi:hypothetical protein